MAYPFLPVNPCCTDVVLNTPCGCSSTITNGGCNNNDPCSTHLTASSTIVYDGPVLPCIVAEPCDTLNVILQKIDEIICNLLTQINYLNNQVTNITNQVIAINGDIINIYNTLGECCSATTTTTSTTTAAPCESFSLDNTGDSPVAIIITDCITGEQEAIVLLPGETNICVETDSPLTVPGTVIVTPNGPCGPTTTTTTSSSSSTTTTTTTISPCECLTFYNGSISSQEITYIDCNGDSQYDIILADATNSYCGCCGEAPGSIDVTISIGGNCIDGACPAEPTTTTTTTISLCDCYDTEITITSEGLAITDDGQITVLYNDCFTKPYIDTYNRAGVYSIGCVDYNIGITALGQVDGIESSIYVPISTGAPCCDTTTTTTTTPPTTTTTTTLPCNCVDIIISQDDLDDATGNTLPFFDGKVNLFPSKDALCAGGNLEDYYSEAGTYTHCLTAEAIPTIILQYVKDDNIITSVQSQIVNLDSPCLVDGECGPTTTTTTTCNPLTNHDFGMQMIYGTSTFPNFLTSLSDACSSIECLNPEFTTCTVSSSVLVYWNSESPIVGDSAYAASTGCELATMTDGYYLFGFGTGIYVVVEIINSTIVSFPICTTTTTTTVGPTTTTTSSSTSTTTSTSSSSTTTTTTTVPSISPSSAEWQASTGGNGCASGDYPATIPNIPAPINFTTMFSPVISWSDIEYIEIVTVTPVAGFTVEYDGATLAPGDKLYPTSDFSWADTMSLTRDSFDCTNTFEEWDVKIKLYAYTELTNTATFSTGFVQTLCPDCTTTTTTTSPA